VKFEWDNEKDKANFIKHGINFETAARVFEDEYRIEMYDKVHSDREDRYVTIGMVKGEYIMTIRKEIDFNKPLTREQIKMLEALEKRQVVPDEDCPELTDEQLSEFRRISVMKKEERRKQTVTIRLSPQALAKAKSLGKGYTSILARILEKALEDNEMIRKCL